MATFTAQILVGRSHPNDGGILPKAILWLSENDRPAWVLHSLGAKRAPAGPSLVWIPTVQDMLADGVLMALTHGTLDAEMLERLPSLLRNPHREPPCLYDVLEETRQHLYSACRALPRKVKLAITVFHGSTVFKQLPSLAGLQQDVEVCAPVYFQEYSRWSKETKRGGHLDPEP